MSSSSALPEPPQKDRGLNAEALAPLAQMSPSAVAAWLRVGIAVHQESLESDYERPDFSGFEALAPYFGDHPPVLTLVQIYKALSVRSRAKFREGIADLISTLPIATDRETAFVVPTALTLAGRIQAYEVFVPLQKRVVMNGGWSAQKGLYHRVFQFCQALASNSTAAPTIRALLGKRERNRHFGLAQVRAAFRVMLRSEPHRVAHHIAFFDEEFLFDNILLRQIRDDIKELIDEESLASALQEMPEWAASIIAEETSEVPARTRVPLAYLESMDSVVDEILLSARNAPDNSTKALQYAKALTILEQVPVVEKQLEVFENVLAEYAGIDNTQREALWNAFLDVSDGAYERICNRLTDFHRLFAHLSRTPPRSIQPAKVLAVPSGNAEDQSIADILKATEGRVNQ